MSQKLYSSACKKAGYPIVTTVFFLFISFVSFAYDPPSVPLTATESIRANLYLLNDDNTTKLADGDLAEYNNLYHDSVTFEDARKFTNINENLGLDRYGTVLAIERRPVILKTDTLFFKLSKTTQRNYQFEFITTNLDHPGLQGFLTDAYSGTSTQLNLNGTTKINFSINADAASADINRFKIIYKTTTTPSTTLPVTFAAVSGAWLNNKISIDWKVESEINIANYMVQRSANGIDFTDLNSNAITAGNKTSNSYKWTDEYPLSGNNFYRIKSIDLNGAIHYSITLKVATTLDGNGSVNIYPNPVKDNQINLTFTNQPAGNYHVRLINNNGQVFYTASLPVSNGNISQALFLNKKLANGMYNIEISKPDNTIISSKVIVQ